MSLPIDKDSFVQSFREVAHEVANVSFSERCLSVAPSEQQTKLTVCIPIDGSENYCVFFDSDKVLAEKMALAMLGGHAELLATSDYIDAFSEFGNILGGKLKRELQGRELGLPMVTERKTNDFHLPASLIVFDVPLSFENYQSRLYLVSFKDSFSFDD